MDIAALSMSMSSASLQQQVGLLVMGKAMEAVQSSNQNLQEMMIDVPVSLLESTPGSNLDISV